MYSKNGKIMLTKKKIVFFDCLATSKEEFADQYANYYLDFFTYQKKPYKLLYTIYHVEDILYAFKRRFLFEKQCIDLIFKN